MSLRCYYSSTHQVGMRQRVLLASSAREDSRQPSSCTCIHMKVRICFHMPVLGDSGVEKRTLCHHASALRRRVPRGRGLPWHLHARRVWARTTPGGRWDAGVGRIGTLRQGLEKQQCDPGENSHTVHSVTFFPKNPTEAPMWRRGKAKVTCACWEFPVRHHSVVYC